MNEKIKAYLLISTFSFICYKAISYEEKIPRNKLKGGKGDKLSSHDVNAKELAMGIKVEMEHTDDKRVAKEIALDHLAEDKKYYSKLKKFHLD